MRQLNELLKQLRLNPEDPTLKEEVQQWLQQHPDDLYTHLELKKHWLTFDENQFEEGSDEPDQVLDNIRAIQKAEAKEQSQKIQRDRRLQWMSVAAGILLPVLFVYGWLNHGNAKAMVAMETQSEVMHIVLPDSSEVWLNAESKISYPKNFQSSGNRLVSLNGQAYFKVTHDKKHPFIVQTSNMDIKVLGTSFDVSAYADDRFTSSTLEEGSIAVLNKEGKTLDLLKPGEQIELNLVNNSITKKVVETTNFTSWTSGQLIFKDACIRDITRTLSRRFGRIIAVSPDLAATDYLLNLRLQDESLEEICELIALTTNAKLTISEDQILFEKK